MSKGPCAKHMQGHAAHLCAWIERWVRGPDHDLPGIRCRMHAPSRTLPVHLDPCRVHPAKAYTQSRVRCDRPQPDHVRRHCGHCSTSGSSRMKFAVVGAGGVGGYYGGLLARHGADVVFVARGEHGRALRTTGLHLRTADGDFAVQVKACAARIERRAQREEGWRAGAARKRRTRREREREREEEKDEEREGEKGESARERRKRKVRARRGGMGVGRGRLNRCGKGKEEEEDGARWSCKARSSHDSPRSRPLAAQCSSGSAVNALACSSPRPGLLLTTNPAPLPLCKGGGVVHGAGPVRGRGADVHQGVRPRQGRARARRPPPARHRLHHAPERRRQRRAAPGGPRRARPRHRPRRAHLRRRRQGRAGRHRPVARAQARRLWAHPHARRHRGACAFTLTPSAPAPCPVLCPVLPAPAPCSRRLPSGM